MQWITVHRLPDIEEEHCSRKNIRLNYPAVFNKKFSFVLFEISLFVAVLFQLLYSVSYFPLKHFLTNLDCIIFLSVDPLRIASLESVIF